jgi:hypothetical protein
MVRRHSTTLRSLGLITDRDMYLMEASNGTVVEVFDLVSMEAKQAAHSHPEVLRMWDRFVELSKSVPFSSLDEATEVHPNLKSL